MFRLTHRLNLGTFAAAAVVLLAACGGGDDTGSPTSAVDFNGSAVLRADGDVDAVAELLESRLQALETPFEMTVSGGEIEVQFATGAGKTANFWEAFYEADDLNFRVPVRDEIGNVVCGTATGATIVVPPSLLSIEVFPDGPAFVCTGTDGTSGQMLWEQASVVVGGSQQDVTADMLMRDAAVVDVSSSRPVLELRFQPGHQAAFEQLTTDTVNYPLGIFLGERLVTAPTVAQPIIGAALALGAETRDELDGLVAVVKSGPLPAPVEAVSVTVR